MSIELLKSQFFSDNIITDLTKDPEIGIVPLEMDAHMSDLVLKEALMTGEEVVAKTQKATDFRKVQAWRLNQKN